MRNHRGWQRRRRRFHPAVIRCGLGDFLADRLTEDFLADRLEVNAADRARLQGKLQGRSIDVVRANATCNDLQHRLNMSAAELKKIVLGHPAVLDYSYDGNIDLKLATLQHRLNLSEAELKKIVLGRTAVLSCDYDVDIEPSLAGLQRRLDLNETELKRLVLGMPTVLCYI